MRPVAGSASPAVTGRGRERAWARRLAWALLSLAAPAVVITPHLLPFYDYDEWVLQGDIITSLLTGGTTNGLPTSQLYSLLLIPVPNLTAPVGIALLHLVLPIEAAGRAFLAGGVLAFSWSYAFLVRRLQGRPTPIEYTGVIWAFGYFLYLGYVSFLFALPLAFVGIGLLARPLTRGTLAWLAGVTTVTFLGHLLAWATLLLALFVHAIVLLRHRRARHVTGLALATAPSLMLFLWYWVAAPVPRHVALYESLAEKIRSMAEPLQFFMRLDPYPAAVPTFPADLLVGAGLVTLLTIGVDRSRMWESLIRPIMVVGLVLAGLAVVSPVSDINSLVRPDQRFLLPAILLVVACLPWKVATPRRTVAVTAGVLVVLGLHLVELLSVQDGLRQPADTLARLIPSGSSVTTIAVPARGGCGAGPGPTIGVPALKWFDVHRLLAADDLRAGLQETSAVRLRFDPVREPGLTQLVVPADQAGQAVTTTATPPEWIEIFACPVDLAMARRIVGPAYRTGVDGDRFAILRRVG